MTSLCFEDTTLACGLVGIKSGLRGDECRSTCRRKGKMIAALSSTALLDMKRYV